MQLQNLPEVDYPFPHILHSLNLKVTGMILFEYPRNTLIMSNRRQTPEQEFRNNNTLTIPVVEENVRVDKQIIETGTSYTVSKQVEEKQVHVDTELTSDEVHVEHIPINKPVSTVPPGVRYEGDTMIISVVQEELVLQKRLVLVEEIHITKRKHTKHVQEPVTLRKENVSVTKNTNPLDRDRSDK